MSSRQPTARCEHAAVGVGEKLFVWAGRKFGTEIQTTALDGFNVSAVVWEQPRHLHGSLPQGLRNAAITSEGENLYSFGGLTRSGHTNAVYQINLCTLVCRRLQPNSRFHAPRKSEGSRSVYFNNKLVVYGGLTSQGRYIDDLHVFNLEKSE